MIAAVIAAVIGVVVVLSTAIGIICYVRKKKRVQRRELHVEEATGAPPTTCSRSSSVRRSSITSRSMNDQQPSTSMDGPQSGTSPMLHERLQDIEDKLEEVNTGVHALSKLYIAGTVTDTSILKMHLWSLMSNIKRS